MKYKLIIGLSLAMLASSNAATVAVGGVISGSTGIVGVTKSGTALTSGGYYIACGSFSSAPAILADFSNLNATVDSMNIFATLTSPTAVGNTLATITGSFVSTGGGNASLYNGKSIYFVIGNGSSRANSTDFAVFTTATDIKFAADVTQTTSTSVSFGSINNTVMVANGGTEIDNISPAKDQIQMVSAVPEASTALLGAIGALGLLRRRRN